MRTSQRMLVVSLLAFGATAAAALVVAACTFPVGATEGTPAGAPGDTVEALGEVVHSAEEQSRCSNGDPTDLTCGYSLGVVNPDKVVEGGPSTGPQPTCHYNTPQSAGDSAFDTVDASPDPTAADGAATVLHGSGTLDSSDDSGDPMGSGETLMCFYSSDSPSDATHLNGANNGAATATVPQPFVVLGGGRAGGVDGS